MLARGVLCKGGIQLKHTYLGLWLKLIPPQELNGGVGGGVHGDTVLGGGRSVAEDVSLDFASGGGDGCSGS